MTDRELLELAAKAAGKVGGDWVGNDAYLDGVLSQWSPLTNDGDAFRLAMKLNLDVRFDWHDNEPVVFVGGQWDDAPEAVFEAFERRPDMAARRAIVRAAAEIGRVK